MFKQKISFEVWGNPVSGKYALRDQDGILMDNTPEDTCKRVSKKLASNEKDQSFWEDKFSELMISGKFAGGGRIMANIGSENYKKGASPINCVIARQIPDSMDGIMHVAREAALILKAGCGIGYDASSIRPSGAYVSGCNATTSGVIGFLEVFDQCCKTVSSSGGRRGAQLAAIDISHPDIESYITCKRKEGTLRYFNLSVLVTDRFFNAVENDENWDLWFWEKDRNNTIYSKTEMINKIGVKIQHIKKSDIPYNYPDEQYFSFAEDHEEVQFNNCTTKDVFVKRIFKTVKARYLFDLIMKSTYDFAEPGLLFIDKINIENNLWFIETIRATNPCGEIPTSPLSNCLLGSMLLMPYVQNAFDKNASFDFISFKKDVCIANRLLDNVVEFNNLPLKELSDNLLYQRRHGLGCSGFGSIFNMLRIPYNSKEAVELSEKIALIMAQESLLEAIKIAKEKGPAPFAESIENRKLFMQSGYMKRLLNSFDNKEEIIEQILLHGVRWSHSISYAPTGTMSLVWGNNCSNGIEPVFSNSYMRNIRVPGKKTKVQEEVMDYSYYEWRQKHGDKPLPSWWRTVNDLSVDDHVNIQSVMQKWCDASISKTINVPVDYPFEDFKQVYIKGWKMGLKGMTTFRFNPEAFSGVLVEKENLEKTLYTFTMADGSEVTVKGSDTIEYDGETHNAANLFDALKEGLYGNM